ncbi:DNA-binding response regulator [Cohnella lupini]|uniref:Very-short-patch-repair endonuclease n=1 Tax=Cohnella lupini TaxID=1294267 RepID=A0A3D9I477_9BACL|nr:DNA-binding response regulator [Cohnella lupini]RED56568.1 hypothetical protein DFP95_11341 [Cohnella lupini]
MNDAIQMSEELEHAYEKWMGRLRSASKGERKRKLSSEDNYAERLFISQVWWPAFGHFTCLHAEHEVKDFKDGRRYLDFTYVTQGFKICIEIDGFGPHWRDINNDKFSDNLMRQNHLVIDGWFVIRFSYRDILEKPRVCQQIIHQLLGVLGIQQAINQINLTLTEQAIINLASTTPDPITPIFITRTLNLHRTTVFKHIKSLVEKELLLPMRSNVKRVCSYRLNKALLLDFRITR